MKLSYKEKLLLPKTTFGRWSSVVTICLAGVSAFGAYLMIHIDICSNGVCEGLNNTKILYDLSPFFIIYSVCCFVVAKFILTKKDLERVYCDAITLGVSIGFILMALAPIMISNELR